MTVAFLAMLWIALGMAINQIIPVDGRLPGGYLTLAGTALGCIPIAMYLARKFTQ